nr:transposase (putative), gypsy type [Tanacetum cinerariifolium]
MDLFNFISASNPTRVKTETRPHAAHEVPLLNATASCVIDMKDTIVASGSSGTPPALDKSPLDFANEDPPKIITERGGTKDQVHDGLSHEILPIENATTTEVILEPGLEKETAAMGPLVNKRCRKRGNDEAKANAPPKVLRKDHATFRHARSILKEKSLAPMGLYAGFTFSMSATQDAPTTAKSVSDPDSLSYAKPQPRLELDIAQSSRKTATVIPIKNVATTEAQGLFFMESMKSGKSTSFLSVDGSPGGIYQPGWGVTDNCRLDTPDACQDMVDHIVPSEYFFELRHLPNTDFLSEYNINLARLVAMGSQQRLRFEKEVRLLKKATTKIAKREQRIQARKDPNGITRLWKQKDRESSLGHWAQPASGRYEVCRVPELRQAFADIVSARLVKGTSEGMKNDIEHGMAGRDLAAVKAYDPEADSKYVKALQDLKDLKCPLVDQLERLKDAPMELIMSSLYLESDSKKDAPSGSVTFPLAPSN